MSGRRDTPWEGYRVTESGLYLRDSTIANATAARHGLLPKLSGVATEYLDGTGAFSTPAGGGGGGGGGSSGGLGRFVPGKNAAAHAEDETFEAAPSGWTDVNWPGTATIDYDTTTPGAMHVLQPVSASSFAIRAKLKAIPAGDFSKVLDITPPVRNHGGLPCGLIFSTTNTAGTGNQSIFGVFTYGGSFVSMVSGYSNFNSFNGPNINNSGWGSAGRVLLRWDRLSGNNTFYWGFLDPNGGIHWDGGYVNPTYGGIAYWGFCYSSSNSSDGRVEIDFHDLWHFPTSFPADGARVDQGVSSVGSGTGSTLTYTTNLSFHYKASNATRTGSRITALNDSAGSGVNLAQATAANQPHYLPNRWYGQPFMLFDGSKRLTAASSPMTATDNFTVFTVVIPYAMTPGTRRYIFINGSGADGYGLAVDLSTLYSLVGNVAERNTTALVFPMEPQILMVQRSAGTMSFYLNNHTIGNTNTDAVLTPTSFDIGNQLFVGAIAEVLGFNAVLGSTDRGTVFADLGAAYNIPVE